MQLHIVLEIFLAYFSLLTRFMQTSGIMDVNCGKWQFGITHLESVVLFKTNNLQRMWPTDYLGHCAVDLEKTLNY